MYSLNSIKCFFIDMFKALCVILIGIVIHAIPLGIIITTFIDIILFFPFLYYILPPYDKVAFMKKKEEEYRQNEVDSDHEILHGKICHIDKHGTRTFADGTRRSLDGYRMDKNNNRIDQYGVRIYPQDKDIDKDKNRFDKNDPTLDEKGNRIADDNRTHDENGHSLYE